MIGDIVRGKEKSKLVVLQDSVKQSGRPLLISLINNLCQRVEKVHVVCFEKSPDYLKDFINTEFYQRLVFHDGSTDVLGWESAENLSVDTDLVKHLSNRSGHHANNNVAIVIDSLSPMMLHRQAPYTCQTLSRLMSAKIQEAEVEQVVCLLHRDLHDDHSIVLLNHLATTIVKVTPPKLGHFHVACNTLHKRLSGKVIRIDEHFNLDEQYCIQDVTEVKNVDTSTVAMETKQSDPTANLTFNLTLTDKEKEARSQVKLPYTYDVNREDNSTNFGEGKIFYQPDDADDFDEEDPDDDLDI